MQINHEQISDMRLLNSLHKACASPAIPKATQFAFIKIRKQVMEKTKDTRDLWKALLVENGLDPEAAPLEDPKANAEVAKKREELFQVFKLGTVEIEAPKVKAAHIKMLQTDGNDLEVLEPFIDGIESLLTMEE